MRAASPLAFTCRSTAPPCRSPPRASSSRAGEKPVNTAATSKTTSASAASPRTASAKRRAGADDEQVERGQTQHQRQERNLDRDAQAVRGLDKALPRTDLQPGLKRPRG